MHMCSTPPSLIECIYPISYSCVRATRPRRRPIGLSSFTCMVVLCAVAMWSDYALCDRRIHWKASQIFRSWSSRPQCPAGEIWTDVEAIDALLDRVAHDYSIDPAAHLQ